jgi:hypothetical protein
MDLLVCYHTEQEMKELVYEIFRIQGDSEYNKTRRNTNGEESYVFTIYKSDKRDEDHNEAHGYFKYAINEDNGVINKWYEHFGEKGYDVYRVTHGYNAWVINGEELLTIEEFNKRVGNEVNACIHCCPEMIEILFPNEENEGWKEAEVDPVMIVPIKKEEEVRDEKKLREEIEIVQYLRTNDYKRYNDILGVIDKKGLPPTNRTIVRLLEEDLKDKVKSHEKEKEEEENKP